MKSGDHLGKPAGNWLERGIGQLIDALHNPRLADAVDRLGITPREVEHIEATVQLARPDVRGPYNLRGPMTEATALALGGYLLDRLRERDDWEYADVDVTWEDVDGDRHKARLDGRTRGWVRYTERDAFAMFDQTPPGYDAFHGPLTRLEPMPPWGGGTWTSDQVNSADFAVMPSEAAAAIVGRPWDAAVPENTESKEDHMQDDQVHERIDRERAAERTNPDGVGRELPDWLPTDSTIRGKDPSEWICGNPDCGHKRRSHTASGAGACAMVDCPCEDFQLHRGGTVPQTGINVLKATKGKVHITGNGTPRDTTVALQVPRADDDGFDEIPIANVTYISLNQGMDGPGTAYVTTAAIATPVDVVLDAEIGPKQITELRIRLYEGLDKEDHHTCDFIELEDQDGEGVGHFESVDDGDGYRYIRIPIMKWPGNADPGKVMVNSHVETARRLLAMAAPRIRESKADALGDGGSALMCVMDAIDELEKAPVIPGGVYAELKHAIARGDAGKQVAEVLEDELKRKQAEGADLRSAVAAALPVVRDLVERQRENSRNPLSPGDRQAIGELERIAVGANPEYAAGMAAARARIAELEEQVDDQRAAIHQQAARLSAHEDSSRVLLRHLAGQSPAWWVEAGEALKRLHDLTHPAMMAGANTDDSAEKG